ncbi:MAG: 30S ribosomal protein S12 methylthiotransferase RimO [Candidatus Latescibacterota bacterium]|nr:30S ribosomal protein S12 methylthiotransferase RimO [Candidatus Latescibacterota bacterium]
METVSLITLGCPKNTVDSERMHRLLERNGYRVSEDATEADVVVVNTCGFIQPAKEESISTVLDAADLKIQGKCRGLIVTGCLAERYQEELKNDLTEADLILGLSDEKDIVSHCDRLLGNRREGPLKGLDDRHILTPSHWAYLRISDGCDRTCAFCAIPGIRGKNLSVPIEELKGEAERLVANGTRELALIAQDTMRYGADIYDKPRLTDLLEDLISVDGLEWIRLLYTYPTGWRDDLLDLLASEPKLCGYVDMPIQHASDPILKAMNRGTTQAGTRKLIERLHSRVPGLTIRSSVIVGFPGETDTHFEEMLAFLEEARFNRLVAFVYSHEENTSASLMIDDVPEEVKTERLNQVMDQQETITMDINDAVIGETMQVLIDRPSDDPNYDWIGRTRMDAPEIDGEVLLSGQGGRGLFAKAKITDGTGYDLVGTILEAESPGNLNLLTVAPPRA